MRHVAVSPKAATVTAVVLSALLSPSIWAQTNARITFSIDGPCGELLLGPPGSLYDDGTGGGPPYFVSRVSEGHNWTVVLTTEENPDEYDGVSAWAYSLGEEGALDITDITTNGTAGCSGGFPECRRTTGFDDTYLTGPPDGRGPQTEENRGALSFVLLKFDGLDTLPPEGRELVARIRVTGRFPDVEGESATGRIVFAPRSIGGRPLDANVDVNRKTVTGDFGDPPLAFEECAVTLKATSVSAFVRCDANSDGRLGISDAVSMLAQIFLGAEASCRAASDCNDDGERDISDPVWWLTYLFRRGPPPPAPFPACGKIDIPIEECPPRTTGCPTSPH